MAVESYSENNMTATIANYSGSVERRGLDHYWLGLASLDDLRTNTLESAAGALVSQYSGRETPQPIPSGDFIFAISFRQDSGRWISLILLPENAWT